MNNFLNSLILFIGLGCTTAFAASDAPHDISPSLPEQSDSAEDSDSDSTEISYSVKPPAPVSMGKISKLSSDSFGTLSEGQGGFPNSIWKNDDRTTDEFLLGQLRSGVANETLRNMVIKLLMTQSEPPQGTSSADWFILRVNALAGLGQDTKVAEMLQSVPQSLVSQNMLQFEAVLAMAQGNYEKGCAQAISGASSADEVQAVFWKKLDIACKAHSGKHDEASVGLDMLRETDAGDQFFQEVIAHISNKDIAIRSLPAKISLFDFSLIRLANATEMLKDKIDALPAIAVKYLAAAPDIDINLREKATAKAQQMGILPSAPNNRQPEQPLAKPIASDVMTLITALGTSDKQATDADNAVIARLALDEAGIIDSRRIEKLLTLMQLFGYKVPDATWQKLFTHKNRFDGQVPPAVLIDWLNHAALANRKGEVILLTALIAGNSDTDKMCDLALVPVIKALKITGFEREARAAAYDAVKIYH
jgi:hypothetical protein